MQFKNIVAAAALAATASALPTASDTVIITDTAAGIIASSTSSTAATDLKYFSLISIRSGSNFQNSGISASQSMLWINHKQDADCASNVATFQLNTTSQELFLFNSTEVSKQQFYTDRSGMGQGIIQYTNGMSSATGSRLETKGFAINDNDVLQFDGADFLACPYSDTENEYSVWVDVGLTNPAYNPRNCTGFLAKVIDTPNPVGCLYTNN